MAGLQEGTRGDRDEHRTVKVLYGLVSVTDGKCKPQPARLKVSQDVLVVQREEFVFQEDDENEHKPRKVCLSRRPDGSLGLSIKGGREYNLPIFVSKVCRSMDEDPLYVGDAIIKVNNIRLYTSTHEEALEILRTAGPDVVLSVRYCKSAAPFLLKKLRLLVPEQAEDRGEDLKPEYGRREARDSGISANGGHGLRSPGIELASPCSVASSEEGAGIWHGIPKVKRRWVDANEVPLSMAYVTRYIHGSDKIRQNGFEVRGNDGSTSGIIQTEDISGLSQWIKVITEYANALTAAQAGHFNRQFSSTEQITYMSWVAEGVMSSNQSWQTWYPKFLALRGTNVYVFDKPPMELAEWSIETENSCYKLYESMFRVMRESENIDERQHCFMLQSVNQESRYFSLETRADLLRLENAWHKAVCTTISNIGSQTFHVVYKNIPAAFTMDWDDGFMLKPFASPNYHFIYSFSQLKNSTDDGNAKVTLVFQDIPGSPELVEQELICPKLQHLLFFMHTYLMAKVSSIDPSFHIKKP